MNYLQYKLSNLGLDSEFAALNELFKTNNVGQNFKANYSKGETIMQKFLSLSTIFENSKADFDKLITASNMFLLNQDALDSFGSPTSSGFGSPTSSGFGSSTGSGFGSSTGSGFGSSTGSGFGSSTGSGFGSSTGSGFGSSTGSGFGSSKNN